MPPKRNQRGLGGDEPPDNAAGGGSVRSGKKDSKKDGKKAAEEASAGGSVRSGKKNSKKDGKKEAEEASAVGAAGAAKTSKKGGKTAAVQAAAAGSSQKGGPARRAAAVEKGAGEDGAAAVVEVAGNPGGGGGGAASVEVGGGRQVMPKIADFSGKSSKNMPKKGGSPPTEESDTKEKTGTWTAAVEAGSGGEEPAGKKKLSRRALRQQKKAEKGLRLQDKCEEVEEQGLLVDEEIDEIEGNQTKPKNVKKGKIARREAPRLEEKDEQENEIQRLIRELSIAVHNQYLASGTVCRAEDPLKDEEDPSEAKQLKKTGRKALRQQGGGEWWDVPEKPIQDPTTVALKLCELFEATVEVITHNIARQETVADSPMIRLTSNPTRDDLIQYSNESMEIYRRCCPFSITVQLQNGITKEVSVTPAKPVNIEDYTYHILALMRAADNAEVHLLIEQFSNYITAFKVVLYGEDPNLKPWLILGLTNKLPSRFKRFKNLKCDEGYKEVGKVYLHKERIPEVFEFFVSYDVPDPEKKDATDEEEVLLFTSFVCFCELNRLGAINEWALDGVTRDREHYLKLPLGYPSLLRDWSFLCKLVFKLYLAILEEPMLESLPVNQRKASPFFKTMSRARQMWRERQEIQPAITFFFEDERKMNLEWLCGEHVTLLRHDFDSCNKLLMRYLGYEGYWLKDIRAAYEIMGM